MKKTFVIYSSHGSLTANKKTGKVVSKQIDCDCEDCWVKKVVYVNVTEWEKYWNKSIDDVDILDIGLTYEGGDYIPPVESFRKEILEQYNETGGFLIR